MERRSSLRPQPVLIVDDCDDIRHMWRTWLTGWQFSVAEAANGAEAVRNARLTPPHLILMDLWMPVLDGLGAIKQLRAHPATAQVPVIALSAQSVTPTPHEIREAGCNAFLGKAVGAEALIAQIRLLLVAPGTPSYGMGTEHLH